MSDFYKRDGTAYKGGVVEWAEDFKKMDRRVVETTLPDGKRVSTVFLGLDHQYNPGGPPLIFETMVFSEKESVSKRIMGMPEFKYHESVDMDRYSNEEEALLGHKRMVQKWS